MFSHLQVCFLPCSVLVCSRSCVDCWYVIVCVLSECPRMTARERPLDCLNQNSAQCTFLNYLLLSSIFLFFFNLPPPPHLPPSLFLLTGRKESIIYPSIFFLLSLLLLLFPLLFLRRLLLFPLRKCT